MNTPKARLKTRKPTKPSLPEKIRNGLIINIEKLGEIKIEENKLGNKTEIIFLSNSYYLGSVTFLNKKQVITDLGINYVFWNTKGKINGLGTYMLKYAILNYKNNMKLGDIIKITTVLYDAKNFYNKVLTRFVEKGIIISYNWTDYDSIEIKI